MYNNLKQTHKQLPNTNLWIHKNSYPHFETILTNQHTKLKTNKHITKIIFKNLKNTNITIESYESITKIKSIEFTINKDKINLDYLPVNYYEIEMHLAEITNQLYLKNATKKELNIINTIFIKNNTCPICESKNLTHSKMTRTDITTCKNKCYSITTIKNKNFNGTFEINKKTFNILKGDLIEEKIKKAQQIYNEIQKLKQNENYLINFLIDN